MDGVLVPGGFETRGVYTSSELGRIPKTQVGRPATTPLKIIRFFYRLFSRENIF